MTTTVEQMCNSAVAAVIVVAAAVAVVTVDAAFCMHDGNSKRNSEDIAVQPQKICNYG